ncbi:nickel/cobalt transporter [Pasteurella bettyae]|uniref:nickel/cobalt transporter n=1 Tax=Pasteurella bettyae TaxID=752 RepID=UPI003D2897E9
MQIKAVQKENLKHNKWIWIVLLISLIIAITNLFPWLFTHIVVWQREFNQLISDNLQEIKHNPRVAGSMLILISFLYGIFHAAGPGHGKFIIVSYLSTHQSKLKKSMKLSFLSSLMQGVVAILATSIVVVILNLSSAYFKLSQLWLERVAYLLVILLGLRWCYQSFQKFIKKHRTLSQANKVPHIRQINVLADNLRIGQNITQIQSQEFIPHEHGTDCGCGHKHMPEHTELEQATSWKSQFLVIMSIGMRPCTGAIFVLFLSYMLNLYAWGIVATLAMSIGTGLALSSFAAMVQYARSTAIKVGKWYLSPTLNLDFDVLIKLIAGLLLIFFAISLLYGTTLPSSGGATLFGR